MRLDGKEVYRRDGLTTRTQIGLADSVELPAGEGEVLLEVSLPERGVELAQPVSVAGPTYVGVSLAPGALTARAQHEPFGYV